MNINDDAPSTLSQIGGIISRYFRLLLEDTRLSVAEKLSRLLASVALFALLTVVSTAAMLFISIAVGLALTAVMEPLWSFICIAGFYILLLVVLVVFRTQLLVNPIARFITRLLIQAPQKEHEKNDQSAPVS